MMMKPVSALALLVFTIAAANAAEPTPTKPTNAPVPAPMPAAPVGEDKPGIFSRFFGNDGPSAGPGAGLAPMPAPVDNSFAKVESEAGTWTVNMTPAVGEMQYCTANFMPKAPAATASGAAVPMLQQAMNVTITRVHSMAVGTQNMTDTLQYSISATATPKTDAAVMTVDGAGVGRTNMQNMNISASGDVADLPALRKTLANGKKVVFAAGDQRLTVPADTMIALLKKMDDCIDKAAKQAK